MGIWIWPSEELPHVVPVTLLPSINRICLCLSLCHWEILCFRGCCAALVIQALWSYLAFCLFGFHPSSVELDSSWFYHQPFLNAIFTRWHKDILKEKKSVEVFSFWLTFRHALLLGTIKRSKSMKQNLKSFIPLSALSSTTLGSYITHNAFI